MTAAHLPSWYDDALCAQVDPEAFFPEKGGSTANAKRTCLRCDVTTACLTYALNVEQQGAALDGIWGGASPMERRKMRRGQRKCRDCGALIPAGKGAALRCPECRVKNERANERAYVQRKKRRVA